jgi:Tfp pilus assembly protein PilF
MIVCPACHLEVRAPKTILPLKGRVSGSGGDIEPKFLPVELPDFRTIAEQTWGARALSEDQTQEKLQQGALPKFRQQRHQWIGIGVILMAFVGIVVAYVQMSGLVDVKSAASVVESVTPPPPPADQLDPIEIVNQFLNEDTSMEERIALLREPYDPVEARKHLEAIQSEWKSGVDSITPLGQAQMLDIGYHGFYVHFHNGAERYICTVEQRDGFRIDWSAYARTDAKATWARLLQGDLPTAVMQVSITPGNYYNFNFSDKQAYSSFVLRSPDCDTVNFGYARRNSVTERIILKAVAGAMSSTGLHPALMTLRLESIDQSHQKKQFLISHVVATSWVASTFGTVEELWVDPGIDFDVSADDMAEFAGAFDAPLMFQQGLELQQTDPEGAARYFRKALENQEDFFPARLALANVLSEQGQLAEAETELKAVLVVEEKNVEAHYQLAICAVKRGDLDQAAAMFETTVRLDPNHALALNNLAWILSTHRDKNLRSQPRVVEMAERAVKLGNESQPSCLATLSVAFAAAARFEEAVKTTEKALAILRDSDSDSDRDLKEKLAARLVLFQNGREFEPD